MKNMHQSIRKIAMVAKKLQADDSGVCGQVVWLYARCLIRFFIAGFDCMLFFYFCILPASLQISQGIKCSGLFDF